ncbi:MAG: diguanylate cyclase, partial [Candidatus Eremiobacteraeota bacterium]|nr:diguanylate cyclase [Candidatus Eremiobacteraeota bacterium]
DGNARGFVKIAHDITARNAADQTIKRQAFHDDLTQLPNRAYFSDCLRRSIARAKRHPADRFAVIFLDLDRFKVINDSVGHVLADTLLAHVEAADGSASRAGRRTVFRRIPTRRVARRMPRRRF